jgi:hypothetical protein
MKEKILYIAGLLLISAGILFNEWVLAALFSSDGVIALSHRVVIWVVDLSLISIGLMLILFKRTLTKESIFVITGLLFIPGAILFIEKFLPVMMNMQLSSENRIFLRFVEVYSVITGLMMVLYRKSIDFKDILLFGITSLLCFALFLSYDFYRAYSIFDHPPQIGVEHSIHNVHVKDRYLGWKPKVDGIGRHIHEDYDVTYEIDHNGFKKVYNTEQKPHFSIYFFGDSFTFGVGVTNDDTFPNIINNRYLRKEVNVYNAGVMGYGIVQMFQRFLNIEDLIVPGDLVIFTPLSEDIERQMNHPIANFLVTAFVTVDFEAYPIFDNGAIKYRKIENTSFNKFKALPFVAPYTGKFWSFLYSRVFMPDLTKQSIEMVKIIKQKTERRGGLFVLIFLPRTAECEKGSYLMDISGFSYYDIMQFFPSDKEELDKLRFMHDGHWNVKGHKIAARAIVETLVNENVIDKKYLKSNSRIP